MQGHLRHSEEAKLTRHQENLSSLNGNWNYYFYPCSVRKTATRCQQEGFQYGNLEAFTSIRGGWGKVHLQHQQGWISEAGPWAAVHLEASRSSCCLSLQCRPARDLEAAAKPVSAACPHLSQQQPLRKADLLISAFLISWKYLFFSGWPWLRSRKQREVWEM